MRIEKVASNFGYRYVSSYDKEVMYPDTPALAIITNWLVTIPQ